MNQICISAMLQSQQVWLPDLKTPVKFDDFMETTSIEQGNYIAHCSDGAKEPALLLELSAQRRTLVCIGPEGDFTRNEIELAKEKNFAELSLGTNRLRTETAGLVAAVLLTRYL